VPTSLLVRFASSAASFIAGVAMMVSVAFGQGGPVTAPATVGHELGSVASIDIGVVDVPGSFAMEDDRYHVTAAGRDIWNREDSFFFLYVEVTGDVEISGKVSALEPVRPWTKAGLMIRETLQPESSHASVVLTPDNGAAFQRRVGSGNVSTSSPPGTASAPYWLRLVRTGDTVTTYDSADGEDWRLVGSDTVKLADSVLIGLAVASLDALRTTSATFEQVRVTPLTVDAANAELERAFSEPGDASTGLHYTAEEVAIWRERSRNGPYRVAGDVRENSPGDWVRILDDANRFVADPERSVWTGPEGDGCVSRNLKAPPESASDDMRDAAFVYLVAGGDHYREAVKRVLLTLAQTPNLDFSDRDRWCPGRLSDASFAVAQWMSRTLVTYDYLGVATFTTEERALLEAWFRASARYFANEVDASLSQLFVDRSAGDYRLTEVAEANCGPVTHWDGHRLCAIHLFYNNRRASQAQFVGLVGLHQNDAVLERSAKLFFEEWLEYSVFPDGMMGEYERWEDDLPDLGWAYAASLTATMVTMADSFARHGDTSLYDLVTSEGALGTAGGAKSLLLVIRALGSHVDGSVERYGTDDRRHAGQRPYRIDGVHESSGWFSLHDVLITPANVYYQDDYVHGMYTRTGAGMPSYPARPALYGPRVVWMGDGGLYPAVLFMFGDREGEAWPYPSLPPPSGTVRDTP